MVRVGVVASRGEVRRLVGAEGERAGRGDGGPEEESGAGNLGEGQTSGSRRCESDLLCTSCWAEKGDTGWVWGKVQNDERS